MSDGLSTASAVYHNLPLLAPFLVSRLPTHSNLRTATARGRAASAALLTLPYGMSIVAGHLVVGRGSQAARAVKTASTAAAGKDPRSAAPASPGGGGGM
jgi:hypothetical protein